MRQSCFLLLGLSCLLSALPVAAQNPPPRLLPKAFQKSQEAAAKARAGLAHKILRRMVQAEVGLAFQAREVTVGMDGRSTEQWVKRDPKLGIRRESIKPEGILLVDDQRRQFLVHQREKSYQEGKSQLADIKKRFQEALRAGDGVLMVELQGTDTIAGRPTDVLVIHLPQGVAGTSRRFWVDRETGLRLRTEERAPDGRILSNSYYLSLDLNPSFKPDDFAPPPVPPGFKRPLLNVSRYKTLEEAAKDGVTVKQPSWLPMGFTLRTVNVTRDQRPRTTLLWGNGLTTISLVSIASPMPPMLRKLLSGADSGVVQPAGGERSYAWKTADGYALVIGNLPDDQLKRIADSVR